MDDSILQAGIAVAQSQSLVWTRRLQFQLQLAIEFYIPQKILTLELSSDLSSKISEKITFTDKLFTDSKMKF